jgi:LCP family protein required for cell wall assembly
MAESRKDKLARENRHLDGFVRPARKRRLVNADGKSTVLKSAPRTAKKPLPTLVLPVTQTTMKEPTETILENHADDIKGNKKSHGIGFKLTKKRILLCLVLIVVIIIGLVGWDVWQLDHKVNHLAVRNLTTSVGGAENILVAGSTNRCNLKVQNAQWGFCSQGVTGVNSDIIFIVHIDPRTKKFSILSIPRDTFVPNARSGNEAFKIDAALYQGPGQLVSAIQEDFGIPIQHYAEVGFDGFVNIVNAVGGIKMDFPMPVYDSESYLNITTPGCQLLNGVEALQVVRARHLQYDPPTLHTTDKYLWPQEVESDIARITRTHEFLRVLGSTVLAKGLSNPITDQKLVDAIAPQVQVDSGLSTSAMIQIAETLHGVNIDQAPQYTLPVSTTDFGTYYYDDSSFGDVVFPAEPNDESVIDQFLGESGATDTMSGKPLPKPNTVTVNVVNGSGVSEQATQTVSSLQVLGFRISGTPTSQAPLSSEAVETVVAYASQKTEAQAEAVARVLAGPVILSKNASLVTSAGSVSVITGTGLSVDQPVSQTTSSSTSSVSTTTSTAASATTSASSPLAPASTATQGLSAWDPRACAE